MNVSQNLSLSVCLWSRCYQIGGRQTDVVRHHVENEAGQLLFLPPEPQDEAKAGP